MKLRSIIKEYIDAPDYNQNFGYITDHEIGGSLAEQFLKYSENFVEKYKRSLMKYYMNNKIHFEDYRNMEIELNKMIDFIKDTVLSIEKHIDK